MEHNLIWMQKTGQTHFFSKMRILKKFSTHPRKPPWNPCSNPPTSSRHDRNNTAYRSNPRWSRLSVPSVPHRTNPCQDNIVSPPYNYPPARCPAGIPPECATAGRHERPSSRRVCSYVYSVVLLMVMFTPVTREGEWASSAKENRPRTRRRGWAWEWGTQATPLWLVRMKQYRNGLILCEKQFLNQ